MRPFASILLSMLLLAGCGSVPTMLASDPNAPPPDYVNVVQTEELQLQLVPTTPGAPPNDHPAAFTSDQLQTLLLALRIDSKGEGKVTLASPQRLTKVANALARGLAAAGPRQDLSLVFFRRKSDGVLSGSSRYLTSARVFYRDRTLHLVFGALDAFFSPYRDTSINPVLPGQRDEPSLDVQGERLEANSAWHWHGNRRDWIEMAATPAAIAAAAKAAPPVAAQGASHSASPLEYGPAAAQSADDTENQATTPPPSSNATSMTDPALVTTPPPVVRSPGAQPESASWAKIEKRLTILGRLRDKGLITKQDYEDKKEELLRKLP